MRIFVSYAHVDWQFVDKLANRLRRYHDVWFDERLHAGQAWWQAILEQLDWCECFIYVLSPESLASKYCRDEYDEARNLDKHIVPIRLQPNIELPDTLQRIQYADFSTRKFEDALTDLVGDLGRLELQARAQGTPPPAQKQQPVSPPSKERLDHFEAFREAVEARQANDHETALRIFNTLVQTAPDFLSEQVAGLIQHSQAELERQARRKEYDRLYQQISLLTLDPFTLEDAQQMWEDLQNDFPEIDDDPEELASVFHDAKAQFEEGQRQQMETEWASPEAGEEYVQSATAEETDASREPEVVPMQTAVPGSVAAIRSPSQGINLRWIVAGIVGAGVICVGLVVGMLALAGAFSGGGVPANGVAEQPVSTDSEEEMAEERTFTVGILGPFTGPAAYAGDEFRTSTEMRFEDIDYTIGDYTINVVWIDSQSDPEKAARAYEEAIVQEGVQVGALSWHSSVAVAVMEVTAKHHIPHLFGLGPGEVVNEKFHSDVDTYGYWTTKGWPRHDLLSQNYVTAVNDAIDAGLWEPNLRAAIYGEDTDWGRSFGDGIAAQLEDSGWEVIDYQYFPPDQTEFGPIIQQFQDDDVDLIAGTSTIISSISAFLKQADEQGLESLIIADGLGWYDEWYDLTGDASNYVVDQIPGWTTDAGLDFAKAFTDRHGQEPSPSSGGMAYDGVGFLIEVLKATYDAYGELSSENVMNVVRDQVWTGDLTYTTDDGAIMMSEYNFSDPPDPIVGKGYYAFPVLQYMDGEGVAIWPPEFEQGQLQPPE